MPWRSAPQLASSFLQGAQTPRADVGPTRDAGHQYSLAMDIRSPDALGVALRVAYIVSRCGNLSADFAFSSQDGHPFAQWAFSDMMSVSSASALASIIPQSRLNGKVPLS